MDKVCTAEPPDEPTCSVDDDCNFSAAPYCVEAVCVDCKPDCEGKECGDDGCGGECGVGCPNVAPECNAVTFKCEAQCTPACEEEGRVCGDDGCGGKCGDCDSGLKCDDGQCLKKSCEPGTTICTEDGGGTATCNDLGTGPSKDAPSPCDEDYVCDDTPDGKACVKKVCPPDGIYCSDDHGSTQVCNALGTGPVEGDVPSPCGDEEKCDWSAEADGYACVPMECTPNVGTCSEDNTTVLTCNELGTGTTTEDPGTACKEDFICDATFDETETYIEDACVKKVCPPDGIYCSDDHGAIQLCNALGTGPAEGDVPFPCGDVEKCDWSAELDQFACVPMVCNPNVGTCSEDNTTVLTCNELGTGTTTEDPGTACEEDSICDATFDETGAYIEDACVKKVCPPDGIYCSDDHGAIQLCNALGTGPVEGDVPFPCGDVEKCDWSAELDQFACVPMVCNPNVATCSADNTTVLTCNELGTGTTTEDPGTACEEDSICDATFDDTGTYIEDACVEVICPPNGIWCSDDHGATQVCNALGTGPVEGDVPFPCGDVEKCDWSAELDQFACVPMVCNPNVATCSADNGTVLMCNALGTGTTEDPGTACEEDSICDATFDETGAYIEDACLAVVCTADGVYCTEDNGSTQVCNALGTGPAEGDVPVPCDDGEPCTVDGCEDATGCFQDPLAAGATCDGDGICAPNTCTAVLPECVSNATEVAWGPDYTACDGGDVVGCDEFGTTLESVESCGGAGDQITCVDVDVFTGEPVDPQCACVPDCDGKWCNEADGCGGFCWTTHCVDGDEYCLDGSGVDADNATGCATVEDACTAALGGGECFPGGVAFVAAYDHGDDEDGVSLLEVDECHAECLGGECINGTCECEKQCDGKGCWEGSGCYDGDKELPCTELCGDGSTCFQVELDNGCVDVAQVCSVPGVCGVVSAVESGATVDCGDPCDADQQCDEEANRCVCKPNCNGKICGHDGCGGLCGECPGDTWCETGACNTSPLAECGPDHCVLFATQDATGDFEHPDGCGEELSGCEAFSPVMDLIPPQDLDEEQDGDEVGHVQVIRFDNPWGPDDVPPINHVHSAILYLTPQQPLPDPLPSIMIGEVPWMGLPPWNEEDFTIAQAVEDYNGHIFFNSAPCSDDDEDQYGPCGQELSFDASGRLKFELSFDINGGGALATMSMVDLVHVLWEHGMYIAVASTENPEPPWLQLLTTEGGGPAELEFDYHFCEPSCPADAVCGDDGCGGLCGGWCEPGNACQNYECVPCTPDCTDKSCGEDGCGGFCGNGPCQNDCATKCAQMGQDFCGQLENCICNGTCPSDTRCKAGEPNVCLEMPSCGGSGSLSCGGNGSATPFEGGTCWCDAVCLQNQDCCADVCENCADQDAGIKDACDGSGGSGGGELDFGEPQQIPLLEHPSIGAERANEVFVEDLDGDGDLDILVGDEVSGVMSFYHQGEPLEFSATDGFMGFEHSLRDVHAARVDGDEDMDLLTAAHFNDFKVWLQADGFPGFYTSVSLYGIEAYDGELPPDGWWIDLTVHDDVDQDGAEDLGEVTALGPGKYTPGGFPLTGADAFVFEDGWFLIRQETAFEDVGLDYGGWVLVYDTSPANNSDGIAEYRAHYYSVPKVDSPPPPNPELNLGGPGSATFGKDIVNGVLFNSPVDITLTWHPVVPTNNWPEAIYPADLNDDDKTDVLTVGTGGQLFWHRNDGDEQGFTAHEIHAGQVLGDARDVTAGDVNGDGRPDVVAVSTTGKVLWWSNGGPVTGAPDELSFALHENLDDNGNSYGVEVADINGDGLNDVVVVGKHVVWNENLGLNDQGVTHFEAHALTENDVWAFGLDVADLDNNGYLDILWAADSGHVGLFLNEGEAKSFEARELDNVEKARSVMAADLDQDGDLDVVASGQDLFWFENTLISADTGISECSELVLLSKLVSANGDPVDWSFTECYPGGTVTIGGVAKVVGACETCGYNPDHSAVMNPNDCVTCPPGFEIDVYYPDCTGYCVPAGTAEKPVNPATCPEAPNSCVYDALPCFPQCDDKGCWEDDGCGEPCAKSHPCEGGEICFDRPDMHGWEATPLQGCFHEEEFCSEAYFQCGEVTSNVVDGGPSVVCGDDESCKDIGGDGCDQETNLCVASCEGLCEHADGGGSVHCGAHTYWLNAAGAYECDCGDCQDGLFSNKVCVQEDDDGGGTCQSATNISCEEGTLLAENFGMGLGGCYTEQQICETACFAEEAYGQCLSGVDVPNDAGEGFGCFCGCGPGKLCGEGADGNLGCEYYSRSALVLDGESYLQGGGGAGQGVFIPGTGITGQGNFKFQNKLNDGDLPITMSAWIYMEEVPSDFDWSWPIISKGARTFGSTGGSCVMCGQDTHEEWIFGVRHDGERPVLFYKVVDEEQHSSTSFAGTGNDAWERVSAPLSDHPQGADIRNRWLHVAVVYDGNPDGQKPAMGQGRARLFLNGEPLEGLGHDHNSDGASKYNHIVHSGAADVHIGREASGHVARGQMDDLFVTKTVLSDADVAFLYGHGCPPNLPQSHVWDTDTGLVLATMGEASETVSLSGSPTYKFLQGSLTTFIMNCPTDFAGNKAPFTDGACESIPMDCPVSCVGGPNEQDIQSGAIGLGCPLPTTCGFDCTWGDPGNDDFQDAAVDGYGDAIVVGKNCGGSHCNPMVMRFSPEGELLAHAEHSGLLGSDLPNVKPLSVAIGPDDSIYVVGEASESNNSDFRYGYVARFSPSLTPIWVYLHQVPGLARDVKVDANGTVVVAGLTEPEGKDKAHYRDGLVFVLKNGEPELSCHANMGISDTFEDSAYGVELLDSGHAVVVGSLVLSPQTGFSLGLVHIVALSDGDGNGLCDVGGGDLPFVDEVTELSNELLDVKILDTVDNAIRILAAGHQSVDQGDAYHQGSLIAYGLQLSSAGGYSGVTRDQEYVADNNRPSSFRSLAVHDGHVVAAGTFEKSGVRRMFVSAFELEDGKVDLIMDEVFEGEGNDDTTFNKPSKLADVIRVGDRYLLSGWLPQKDAVGVSGITDGWLGAFRLEGGEAHRDGCFGHAIRPGTILDELNCNDDQDDDQDGKTDCEDPDCFNDNQCVNITE